MSRRKSSSFKGKHDVKAFIGLGTEFKGVLSFEGVIRLDGRFSGEIHSAGTLIIGETAVVEAEIYVDTVEVSGEVHGNIQAKNRVELYSPAKLYGNIVSPVLVIDEGVIFEGNCEMADASGPQAAPPAKKSSPALSMDAAGE